MDMVCKCGGKEFFTEKHGNQTGAYCSACGKWQKWLGKDEIRLFNHGVQDGWISVNDGLPDSYRDVIVCLETREVYCGWYATDSRIWHNMNGSEIESVTYWREMPDPPKMEECAK